MLVKAGDVMPWALNYRPSAYLRQGKELHDVGLIWPRAISEAGRIGSSVYPGVDVRFA